MMSILIEHLTIGMCSFVSEDNHIRLEGILYKRVAVYLVRTEKQIS